MKVVCAVFDSAIQAFGQPFFVAAAGAAVRSFGDEVNRKAADGTNALNAHPDDYILWQLAVFDEEQGMFIVDSETKRVLARGKDLVNQS